jgi:hypothetical protein
MDRSLDSGRATQGFRGFGTSGRMMGRDGPRMPWGGCSGETDGPAERNSHALRNETAVSAWWRFRRRQPNLPRRDLSSTSFLEAWHE